MAINARVVSMRTKGAKSLIEKSIPNSWRYPRATMRLFVAFDKIVSVSLDWFRRLVFQEEEELVSKYPSRLAMLIRIPLNYAI